MTPQQFDIMVANTIAWILLAIVLIIAQSMRYRGFKPYDGLTMMYDRIKQVLIKIWNAIPYWGQSIIIIGLWIFIPAVLISDVLPHLTSLSLSDIPTIILIVIFSGLGIFYIVEELRGTLRKKPETEVKKE